jgi:hypothetical protein
MLCPDYAEFLVSKIESLVNTFFSFFHQSSNKLSLIFVSSQLIDSFHSGKGSDRKPEEKVKKGSNKIGASVLVKTSNVNWQCCLLCSDQFLCIVFAKICKKMNVGRWHVESRLIASPNIHY